MNAIRNNEKSFVEQGKITYYKLFGNSLVKEDGYYGLRDDINQISNFCADYKPNAEIEMEFSFDEHAFVVKKGEKLRIDISSSAFPLYVRHTNNKGLFSE